MSRCVVNVATGAYIRGQQRLRAAVGDTAKFVCWADSMPPGSPSHHDIPYAFKAHALKVAAETHAADLLLWADASILPIRDLEPLWEKIELDGAWISHNGWKNSEWTADSAYADLGVSREENALIPHVVATSFGVNLKHPVGRAIYEDYLRLAQTRAFCGPWMNKNHPSYANQPVNGRCAPCGPPTTIGHRHDQTALSLLAWRHGVELTSPPAYFAYRGNEIESTLLVADGNF